jgi:peroxiredoxin
MSEMSYKPMVPTEGWPVLHLFYHLNRVVWQAMTPAEQTEGKTRLEAVISEARTMDKFQVITVAVIGKADLGFMIVGPDLQQINALEKRISWALGPDVLLPEYVYYSLTEKSEYTQTEAEYTEELQKKEGLSPNSSVMQEKLVAFRERIKKYTLDRMYPKLPDWEYFCFYPMNKKREPGQNWYALDFQKRRDLMGGHARVGRQFSGRVSQLVTGSTGLDDWEWGVTLFAHNPFDIKAIVYDMRFDEVSHGYAEFGPFYNGLVLTLPQIYSRLML